MILIGLGLGLAWLLVALAVTLLLRGMANAHYRRWMASEPECYMPTLRPRVEHREPSHSRLRIERPTDSAIACTILGDITAEHDELEHWTA